MSYDPRLAARSYGAYRADEEGGGKKGSVRAARQALQAAKVQGQMPDTSKIIGLPQRPNQRVERSTAQNQYQDPGNAPSPTPQWPLSNDAADILESRPDLLYPRPPNRGPPPKRPPRPTADELPTPSSPDYRESFQSDDPFSPISGRSSRPLTTSSAASENSSLGEIPDFPIPEPPMPTVQPLPRRIPSLGPPPSSRRGPSSYYTQMSYVSPIAEEAETRSNTIRSHHGSFASSMAIPANGDYYLEDPYVLSDDDETITSENGQESRASDHDDKSGLVTPALVRQASLGRRTKPSLMTIKSADGPNGKVPSLNRKPSPGDKEWEAGIGGAVLAAKDGLAGTDGSTMHDASSDDASMDSPKNLGSRYGDWEKSMDPEKDGSLEAPVHPLYRGTRNTALADRMDRLGRRRPPRIDVDAVRDAEARGSLTSLPELIRRATRLAANLDRGKTASRLGLDFWEAGAIDKKNSHNSNSMADMLAAFPPPGEATPRGGTPPGPNQRRMSQWPSPGRYGADSAMNEPKDKRRRRCCGMPMWTFVTLLIVLLFLIAAAVIIPIVLVVIPKMRDAQGSAAQNTAGTQPTNTISPAQPTGTAPTGTQNSQCGGIIACQNGGVAIPNADRSCNCVCINGFTGRTCDTEGDPGCTITTIGSTTNNATVGSGIPRLIESAENDFNIPLDSTRLVSLFSRLSMSCTAENALITFNGLASRSSVDAYMPILVETSTTPFRSLPLLNEPRLRPAALQQRQAIGGPGVADENGNAGTVSATASSEPAATPTQPISSNPTALDFARLGVLLSLQVSGKLDTAANAQESIQNFLSRDREGNSRSTSVDLDVFTIDLVQLSIKFSNGTTIQASTPNSTTS